MPPEIIDVDALPEWNNPRRHSRSFRQICDQTTIDLTNAGDSESDSDISILSKPARPKASSNGKTKEANIPLPAIEKIRKRSRPTANPSNSQSHPRTHAPPAKKLKLSTPQSTLREQSPKPPTITSTTSNTKSEPIASASTLSISDFALKLSQTTLPEVELEKFAQTMMSYLPSATASNNSSSRKIKRKRAIACIELSDGEEVVELLPPRKRYMAASSSNRELSAGLVDVQYSDPDPDLNIDVESDDPAASSSSHKSIARLSTTIDIQDSDLDPDLDESDDEQLSYDYIHAGYNIHDPGIWTPVPINLNRLQENEELVVNMTQLAISKVETVRHGQPRYVHPDISRWYPSKITSPPMFIWDQLRLAKNLHYRNRPRPTPLQALNKPFTRPWDLDFNLHRLKAVHSFKESPGSINKIEQKGDWTVVASACTGGLPDTVGEQLSPYNRPGSLITWRNQLNIPEGHQLKKGEHIKHYAVHDLKFFPNRTSFVSTGADGIIRLWNLSSDEDDDIQDDAWFNQRLHAFGASPHDLAFKPNTSILAVAEKKIHIFTFRDAQFEVSADFPFYPLRSAHVIGSLAWGSESTADRLFGSSEPCFPTVFDGIHKALDVTTKKSLYQFDASEAGDMLSLDVTGATLALSTRAPENKHLLRIYDTRRGLPTATHLMELERFPIRDGFEGEVNNASFSPDGMYLALARNDNRTHVYDRRMWDRGVIFEYGHNGESKAASRDVYGVVKAQWVQSQTTRRMALVTGGEDGHIRMWDPTMAAQNPENGKVLADVNSDIGHFSLGDPYAGENQLVVGDNSGEVTIFNNVVI